MSCILKTIRMSDMNTRMLSSIEEPKVDSMNSKPSES